MNDIARPIPVPFPRPKPKPKPKPEGREPLDVASCFML